MSFAVKEDGRNFNCVQCPERVQKLRRCREDRENFTEEDGALWPMYVTKGGEQYGFCPAKATWDQGLVRIFQLLVISAHTGVMIEDGGLKNQPSWWVETLGWFLPRYDSVKFASRAASILDGDGKVKQHGGNKRKPIG